MPTGPAPIVHPTAIVGPDVSLSAGVAVGPYCVLSGKVHIEEETELLAHTVVLGSTRIGARCRLGPHAMVGADPNHRGYDGGETHLVIDDEVIVREFTSLHRAFKPGEENATRIGKRVMMMAYSHVAHDCKVGDDVTMANGTQLGGHVVVGDRAFIGGVAAVHQFCRVGRLAVVGGADTVRKDILPFGATIHNHHKGYNAVGCRRAGLTRETLHALRAAFLEIHRASSAAIAAARIRAMPNFTTVPELAELVAFIESTKRGITRSASHAADDASD